jgi:carbon storage regulator
MSSLTLERRQNESVVIGDSITVTVQKVRGNRVKLNIVAPNEVKIMRPEIIEKIMGENQDARID